MLTLSYLYGRLQIKLQIADYNLCQVRNNMWWIFIGRYL